MTLMSFRDYYLIEAVDLDRTWQTYGDAVKKRAGEVKSYTVIDENGRKHFNLGADHVHDKDGEEFVRKKMVQLAHDRHTYSGGYEKMPEGDKRLYHADLVMAKHGKITLQPNYEDSHFLATTLRDEPKEPGAYGLTAKDHDDIKRDAFMNHVKDSVPHPKYIPTVTRMYAEGGIKRMEDIDTQAKEAFTKYHTLATHGRLDPNKHVVDTATGNVAVHRPEDMGGQEEWDKNLKTAKLLNPEARKPISETNFKAFRSIDDVRAVVNHEDHKQFFQQESKAALKGSYTVVHDDDDVTVYHPHTHEASVALAHCPHTGKKAAWCTAANSESGKGYFKDYSDDGPLLIHHPKKPKYPGEMYQTHHGTSQHMDEQDREVHTGTEGIVFDNSTNSAVHFGTSSKHWEARFPGFDYEAGQNYHDSVHNDWRDREP